MTGSPYRFDPATALDIDRLVELEQELFQTDRCSRRSFGYLIRHATVVVVRRPGTEEIVGYAILLTRKNSRKMRIYSLGIVPEMRQSGLGSQLVTVLEEIARAADRTMLTLEVADSNRAAIGLYRRCGFHQYGFRYGYYQDGGHAILMRKSLTGSGEQ